MRNSRKEILVSKIVVVDQDSQVATADGPDFPISFSELISLQPA
jgi:hypothetical protein